MRIPRSRGAASGTLLIVLGLFGAVIPLVGPYFDFTVGADSAWNFGEGHFWLSVVPGLAVVLGAVLLTSSAHRAGAGVGAWIALLGGAWFVTGEQFSRLWNGGEPISGAAAGDTGRQVLERLAYYQGLGALIVALAAFALGRLAVRSVRDAELAREAEVEAEREARAERTAPPPRRTRESGRFDREKRTSPRGDGEEGSATTTAAPPAAREDTRTDTLSAAERVREVAGDSRRGRGLFRRNR